MAEANVLDTIYKQKRYLNPALRRIADFTLKHPDLCKTMTISQLAIACDVAESTVSRFVREIDFKSYQSLKIALAEALYAAESDRSGSDAKQGDSGKYVYEDVNRGDARRTIIEKVLHRNIQTLKETAQQLNADAVDRAVQNIHEADTILFCCMGSSAVAAEEAVMRFSRAGKRCMLYRDESIQLINASTAKEGDVVIGISNSGRSAPVVNSLKLARSSGVPTIAITSFEDSPIVEVGSVSLFSPTQSPPPGLDLYGEATTSVSAQLLIIDILYTCFAAANYEETLRYLEMTYATAIKETRLPE